MKLDKNEIDKYIPKSHILVGSLSPLILVTANIAMIITAAASDKVAFIPLLIGSIVFFLVSSNIMNSLLKNLDREAKNIAIQKYLAKNPEIYIKMMLGEFKEDKKNDEDK